ncbi:MAG: hypothetical protein LUQ36_06665 [Methanoregula sp.]|nr:hypothetical protein [Methanoregula sp.]
MSENSGNNPDQVTEPNKRLNRWLELAVPLFSFGGIVIAFFFMSQGNIQDIRIASAGCIIASFILAYLAWIRPKKDIVALTTPLYAIILFVLPSDLIPDLILPILYAISLTILLVRLKYRFGKPGTAVSMGKELGGSLKSYIDLTRDALLSASPDTAHRATLAFVQFAQGDYAKVAKISATVADQDTSKEYSKSVSRAFAIVKEHAALLDRALPRPIAYEIFDPEDSDLLAKQVPAGQDPDHEFYLALDNALLLLYSLAWNASEQDRPHLLARQVFAQKLMDSE